MPVNSKWVAVTSATGHDPRVYLIENGKKRWLINEQIMAQYGIGWNDIKRISAEKLDSYITAYPLTSANQKIYETKDYIYCIEETWSDDSALGIVGWAVGKKSPLKSLTIEFGGKKKKISHWVNRPEIVEYFSSTSSMPVTHDCGFMAIIHQDKEHVFSFMPNSKQPASKLAYATNSNEIAFPNFPMNKNLEKQFRDIVNNNQLSVLEVGSRVSPGGINKRAFFKKAASYTGIDYLPGKTVDVVGDAHQLKKHFKGKKFGALYSDSVLEHLAMPWKAVIEMNGVLKKGGYIYHSAPACWIPHDMPWDFWRFSDASMKILFSEPFGFKVIDVEFTAPVNLRLNSKAGDDYARFPLSPAFGFVSVLAQKVRNIDRQKIRFNVDLKRILGDDKSTYPEWND